MKILGLLHGQFGDQVINLPTIRMIKEELYPDCHFTLNINQRFQTISPLFKHHLLIDDIYISDEYENFPSARDQSFLDAQKFDRVFNPMQRHKSSDWFRHRHQTEEVANMYDLPGPTSKQAYLHNWFGFTEMPKTATMAVFGGDNAPHKSLSIKNANVVAEMLCKKGYTVIQIGGVAEPDIQGTTRVTGSWLKSVETFLGSDFLITVDTAASWIASAYQHPTIGLYSNAYYGEHISSIQPVNPNAIYLDAQHVNDIPLHEIENAIQLIHEN